ncbi:MAG: DUF3048 domain-containing protein [Coriobacteriales bacterium]|jgi:hypothetical protein|nr:DUF3048 domain-containing protein [Coriobacteriales bacterium]
MTDENGLEPDEQRNGIRAASEQTDDTATDAQAADAPEVDAPEGDEQAVSLGGEQADDSSADDSLPDDSSKGAQRKRLLLIGGAAAALLAAALVVAAFVLTRPTPQLAPPPEEGLIIEEPPPPPPPEPTTWVFPLTGVQTDDEEATLRRILSVKIENTPDARPQTGLANADVIYETVVEGGITRLNCLFQSQIPQEVGPVRSARLSDLSIVPQYDALFFFSGANPYVLDQVAAAGLSDMSGSSLYYRVDYRVAPHNLYLNLAGAHALAPDMGFAATTEPPRALAFASDAQGDAAGAQGSAAGAQGDAAAGAQGDAQGSAANAGKAPGDDRANLPDATSITVPLSDIYIAGWAWDSSSKTYLRSMDGPTLDAVTGEQIATTNLVVLWADYTLSPDGLTSFVDLNGSGTAILFIDGKRIDGSWESNGTPPRFTDAEGKPVLLNPGTSWFEIVDLGTNIEISS